MYVLMIHTATDDLPVKAGRNINLKCTQAEIDKTFKIFNRPPKPVYHTSIVYVGEDGVYRTMSTTPTLKG